MECGSHRDSGSGPTLRLDAGPGYAGRHRLASLS